MDQQVVFVTILGMALVTYVPRLIPVWFLSSRNLPAPMLAWLRNVPVAVLAAMLFPSILVHEGHVNLGFSNLFFWAAIPTLLVAWKTRGLFAPVAVGMLAVAGARALLAG